MNSAPTSLTPPALVGWSHWLRTELAPALGRKETTIRLALIVALITVISMTLQVPEAALSAYMAFFITRQNRVLTALTGLVLALGVTLAIGASLLVYRATYDFPQLRVPAIALSLFAGMFLSRIIALGPLAFIVGFVFAVTQSIAELTPDPDILVRALLWLWVAVVYPVALTVVLSQWLLPIHPEKATSRPRRGFLVADAFRNPAHVRFALKVTLAAMTCYIFYTAIDWAGIHTAFITCCIVALESTGATVRKARLRLVGCLLGAMLGFLSIVFLIPHMESIASLILLTAAVSALAGWIAAGDEHVSYAGLQMAFAFFMCIFQGFAPDTGFETIRDRVVGIILGIVVCSFVFRHVWPESAAGQLRTAIAGALRDLSELLRIPETGVEPDRQRLANLRESIARHMAEAGRAEEFASFELSRAEGAASAGPPVDKFHALHLTACTLSTESQWRIWTASSLGEQRADEAFRRQLATGLQSLARAVEERTPLAMPPTSRLAPSENTARSDLLETLANQLTELRDLEAQTRDPRSIA